MRPNCNVPLTPVTLLRERLGSFGRYPASAVPVDEVIAGTAFFPGGDGLWKEDGTEVRWPSGGIMVLGQDFDIEQSYRDLVIRGKGELDSGTWRQLLGLLRATSVRPCDCFFTNFFMGVRKGEENMGEHPAAGDVGFVSRCQDFLLFQIHVLRPRAILVLGRVVPQHMAALSPDLVKWTTCDSLPALDQAGPFVPQARFSTLAGVLSANVAVLAHPSFRHVNARLRRYAGLVGDAAERRLIADALGR